MPDDFDPLDEHVSRVGQNAEKATSDTWFKAAQFIPIKTIGIDPSTAKGIFTALKKGGASVGLIDEYPLQDANPVPTSEMAAKLLAVTPPIVQAITPNKDSPVRYSLIARFHQIEAINCLTAKNPEHPILCLLANKVTSAQKAEIYAEAALSDRLLALKTANRTWNIKKLSSAFTKLLTRTQFANILELNTGEFEVLRAAQNKAAK